VDIISQISDPQSAGARAVVTEGPGLSAAPTTTAGGGDVLTEVAPEPTSLVLGLIGSGLAAGAKLRRLYWPTEGAALAGPLVATVGVILAVIARRPPGGNPGGLARPRAPSPGRRRRGGVGHKAFIYFQF
jgi:hypothetical protein